MVKHYAFSCLNRAVISQTRIGYVLRGQGTFFSLSKRMHVLFTFEKHAVGGRKHGWTGGLHHRQLLTAEEFSLSHRVCYCTHGH